LQDENNKLKHEEATIEGMEETLHSAQYALDKATGDRLKLENNFKIQVDNDAITINRLKNEGIDLKHTLADRNEEIARLRSTLSNLKYTVDLKRGDANHLKDDNDHLRDVASRLDSDLKIEVDVNNGLKKELEDFDGRNRHLDDDIHAHRDRIRALESDNDHSRIQQDNLNRDIDDIEPRIRDATAQIHVLEGRSRGLRTDLDHLEASIGDLSGKHDAERELYDKIHADLNRENDRNNQLQEDHRRLVEAIENARRDLDALRRDVEELNEKVRVTTASNADLEYQLAELKRHIEVLSRQNHDLNVELDDILDQDRKVREELDRRQAIMNKQKQNEENLKKSLMDLEKTRHSSPKRA
jgi:chromosome segregation ATPase